jgi:hypothetical protein
MNLRKKLKTLLTASCMKKRKLGNGTSLAIISNNLFLDNLRKISIIVFLLSSFFLKAQITCTVFKLNTDLSHYSVSATHDSTFVKYVQFNLSDTVTVSKITYTLSNVTSSSQVQLQNYTLNTIPSAQNLTIANNCQRNQKTVKISLGYFTYSQIKYLVNIKLYDSGNNLLNSSNFNFNH